jgi:hypothetical protein
MMMKGRAHPNSKIQITFHQANALFAWLISHQPAVLFSHNKPATSNQPAVLFSQNKSAPAISHQPTEQAENPVRIVHSVDITTSQLVYILYILGKDFTCRAIGERN